MTIEPHGQWLTLRGVNGRCVRTETSESYSTGARFVAVDLGDGGAPLAYATSDQWGDPTTGHQVMADLWAAATDELAVCDAEFGVEWTFALARGAVRCCPLGTYVRVVDADGRPLVDGSAYWVLDEWAADPELVMGALLGAAAQLQ